VVGQFDFVEGDAQAQDTVGHGWHVTGIAHSVCPECSLLIVKTLDYNGGDDFTIARGIRYAANQGAHVINASFGGPPPSRTMCAAVKDALDRDVLFVAAAGNSAGNDNWSLGYPVRCDPRILVVSASDRYDQPAYFSNYGDMVDIMAPGVDVWSTVPPSLWNPEGVLPASGTSMAAPNVAGAAGLLKSSYPLSASLEIAERLRTTAREVGTIPGVDDVYGPRLDVAQAFGMDSYPLALGLSVRRPWVPRDGGDVPVEVVVRGEGIRSVRLEVLSSRTVEQRLTMEPCGDERYCTMVPIPAQASGAFQYTYVVQAVVENTVGSMYSLQELIYQNGALYLPIVMQSVREGASITPTPDYELTVGPVPPTLIPTLTPAATPE
jgi:subtilisin family serine protease